MQIYKEMVLKLPEQSKQDNQFLSNPINYIQQHACSHFP